MAAALCVALAACDDNRPKVPVKAEVCSDYRAVTYFVIYANRDSGPWSNTLCVVRELKVEK